MQKKDLEKMRAKTDKDLEKKVAEMRVEATKARANMFAGQETNLKKSRLIKKDIAQIMTILKNRELGVEKEKSSKAKKA